MDTGLFGCGLARSRFVYHSSVSVYRYALCIMIKGMSKKLYYLYSGNAKQMYIYIYIMLSNTNIYVIKLSVA